MNRHALSASNTAQIKPTANKVSPTKRAVLYFSLLAQVCQPLIVHAQVAPIGVVAPRQAVALAAGVAPPPAAQVTLPITPSTTAPAGQRPIIDAAQNGVPIVHIAPPSAAGVSRNQYDQFNVNSNGLILNNSTGNVQTQLGGWITGNLQLGPTPARIILNEVTSANPSQLRGYIEVAGQRADIVIANPNGITCDGCGFINTAGRATLTTGAPQIAANGAITGFDVRQGQLSVGAGGLNGTNLAQLDLLARGLVIEGEVWSPNINAIAGANQVLYGTLKALPQTGTGPAPQFAIDIKDVGGMYANQIKLVATEQGLGVNSTGRMAALDGSLQLSANGDITLKDTYARNGASIIGQGNVQLNGLTQSATTTQIQAAGTLTNNGTLDSQSTVQLTGANLNNTGTVIQRGDTAAEQLALNASTANGTISNSGTIYSASRLNAAAANITTTGVGAQTLAAGDINLVAQNISLDGKTQTDASIKVNAVASIANQGTVNAASLRAVASGANASLSNSGTIVTSGDSVLNAASINNSGTVLALNNLSTQSTDLQNTGKLLAANNASITTGTLTNQGNGQSSGLIAADKAMAITTTGALNNAGAISGKTDLNIQVGSATNAQTLTNTQGVLVSDNTLSISANRIDNDKGQIVTRAITPDGTAIPNGGQLNLSAQTLSNRSGSIESAGNAAIKVADAVNNTAGVIQAGVTTNNPGSLSLTSGSVINDGGRLLGREGVSVNTGNLSNQSGFIATTGVDSNVSITAAQTQNQGGVIAASGNATLNTQAFNNTGGELNAGKSFTLNTQGQALDNSGGRIVANTALTISAGDITSNATSTSLAVISSGNSVAIQATGLSNDASVIQTTQANGIGVNLQVGSGTLSNQGGVIQSASQVQASAGQVNNTAGQVLANDQIAINAGNLNNTNGLISGSNLVALSASATGTALNNTAGNIVSNGVVQISTTAANSTLDNTRGFISANNTTLALGGSNANGALNNTQGQVTGTQALAIQAAQINNRDGKIYTGSDLTLGTASQNLTNQGGSIAAGGALTVNAASLDNTSGAISSSTALTVNAQAIKNTAGGELSATRDSSRVASTGNVTLNAGSIAAPQALNNDNGRIVADGDLTLQAGAASNTAGVITSGGSTDIRVTSLANSGTVQAAQNLNITSTGAFSNSGGQILAGNDATINAASISNSNTASANGVISANRDLALNATGQTLNSATLVAGRGVQVQTGSLNNNRGLINAARDLNVQSGNASNQQGELSAGGQANIATGDLDNSAGRIVSNQALTLTTQALNNAASAGQGGLIASRDNLALTAAQVNNRGGLITAINSASLSTQALSNTGGELSSGGSLVLNTNNQTLINDAGRIQAGGATTISSGALSNNGGVVASSNALQISATSLSNQAGVVSSTGASTLALGNGALNNNGGALISQSTLSATSGATSNVGGTITSSQALSLTTQGLNNQGGEISSANTVAVNTQRNVLDNAAGRIVGNAGVQVQAGQINNTAVNGSSGLIASQANVRIDATGLNNNAGTIAAANSVLVELNGGSYTNNLGLVQAGNAVQLNGGTLNNNTGVLLAANTVTVNGSSLSNVGGAVNANAVALNLGTGSLDNTSGQIIGTNSLTVQSGAITNTQGGVIYTRNELTLNTQGQALDNTQGTLASGGKLNITAAQLNNSLGTINSATELNINSQSLTNDGGELSAKLAAGINPSAAATGDVSINTNGQVLTNNAGRITASNNINLKAGDLNNTSAGQVNALGNLSVQASNVTNNSNSVMQAVGSVDINASQAITNSGSVINAGADTTLQAATLTNQADTTAQGSQVAYIGSTGTTKLNVTGVTRNADGSAIYARSITDLTTGSLNNDGSTIAAGKAQAGAPIGSLIVTATGAVSNQLGGVLSAQDKQTLIAGSLNNTKGQVTANNNVSIDTGNGSLTNNGGVINARVGNLTVVAGNTTNLAVTVSGVSQAGLITAGGTLDATTNTLDNTGGVIGSVGNATLNTRGQALINSQGSIQSLADLSITAGTITNNGQRALDPNTTVTNGTISSSGATSITASSVSNNGGSINAVGALNVNASGSITNVGGAIQSSTSTQLTAASIANSNGAANAALDTTGVIRSAGTVTLTGATTNNAVVVANNDVVVQGGALTNSGAIVSYNSNVSVNTQGAALSNSGLVQSSSSAGTTTLTAGGTTNTGTLTGRDVKLTTGSFTNSNGTIFANNNVTANTQAFNNAAGTVVAVNDLRVDTNGQALSNAQTNVAAVQGAAPKGLTAGNRLTLTTGAINNQGGSIVANGLSGQVLTITSTGTLDNTNNGQIKALGSIASQATITATDILNTGGVIASMGSATVTATNLLNNTGGKIIANDTLTLNGATVDNSTAANGVKGTIDAWNVNINASQLNNVQGIITAGNKATITTTTGVNNTNGTITADNSLTVKAPTLVNTGGTLIGTNSVDVTTASQNPGGTIASPNNVTLNVSGDYTNTGTLSAQKNLTVNATNITNTATGVLRANNVFTAKTGNLTNAGEISGVSTYITATGTVTNSGLIDSAADANGNGGLTSISANRIDNTGRVYGDTIALNGQTINNTGSGTVAARNTLFVTGGDLNNTSGGLLYSLSDIVMGGSFDSQGYITGQLNSVLNASSTIEAKRNLSISANRILNRNDNLTLRQVIQPTVTKLLVQVNGVGSLIDAQYCSSNILSHSGGDEYMYCQAHPELYGKRQTVLPTVSVIAGACTMQGDNGLVCDPDTTVINYTWDSPVFAQWGVTPVSAPPAEPGGAGSCTTTTFDFNGNSVPLDVNSPACNAWRPVANAWSTAYQASLTALAAKIDPYNVQVNEDNRFIQFKDYNLYTVASTTQSTTLATSAPAKLLAGGNLSLVGSTVINQDSAIVAGGTLYVSPGALQNNDTKVLDVTNLAGNIDYSKWTYHGYFYDPTRDWSYVGAYSDQQITAERSAGALAYQSNTAPTSSNASTSASTTRANTSTAGTANAQSAATGPSTRINNGSVDAVSAPQVRTRIIVDPTENPLVTANGTTASADAQGVDATRVGNAQAAGAATVSVKDQAALIKGSTATGSYSTIKTSATAQSATAATPLSYALRTVAASGTGERARDVILTATPRISVPNSSLFRVNTAPGAGYLVETDPRFTNGRTFIGSDYFLNLLNLDPSRLAKRYGDGFAEQQLINDQILALTGRRYTTGYTSTEEEYKALMSAGAAFAQQFQLTPGIALSDAQMALLTTDIVWLTTQSITLPDGSTQQVLVPQVYLRRPQGGDLQTGGSLIAASDVYIKTTGDLTNSGTIKGDRVVADAGNDLKNLGGTIQGQSIYLRANNDLTNLSGTIQGVGENSQVALSAGRDIVLQTRVVETTANASNAYGTSTSSRTNLDRIATVQGGNVSLNAGRDLTVTGANVNASNNLVAVAGRDITVTAVQQSYSMNVQSSGGTTTQGRTAHVGETQVTQVGSNLSAGNNLMMIAGTQVDPLKDGKATGSINQAASGVININASNLSAGNNLALQGADITISAGKNLTARDDQSVGKNQYTHLATRQETLTGGQVSAGNNISMNATGVRTQVGTDANGNAVWATDANGKAMGAAGTGNITLNGAVVAGGNAVSLNANNNINVQAMQVNSSQLSETYSKSGNLLNSTQTTTADSLSRSIAQGSVVTGNTVTAVADNNLRITGSTIQSQQGTLLAAGNNLIIEAAQSTSSESHSRQTQQTGLLLSGGATNPTLDFNRRQSTTATTDTLAQAGSSIGSTQGNTTLLAQNGVVAVIASDVSAGKDLSITGAQVVLSGQLNQQSSSQSQQQSATNIHLGYVDPSQGVLKRGTTTQGQTSTSVAATTLNGQNITVKATGAPGTGDATDSNTPSGITLAGTKINTPGALTLDAGKGSLNFNLITTTDESTSTQSQRDLVYQKQHNQGQSTEQAVYNQINAGSLSVQAQGGINVQIGQTVKSSGDTPLTAQERANMHNGATPLANTATTPNSNSSSGNAIAQATVSDSLQAALRPNAATPAVQAGQAGPTAQPAPANPQANLQAAAATLAQQPGMGYLNQLLAQTNASAANGANTTNGTNPNTPPVNWQGVNQAVYSWDYKKQGLTPEGAVIVSLVVAYCTAGAASGAGAALVSSATGTAVVAGTGAAVASSAIAAGLATLASQAAVSLVNNQGNLGDTLKDLGSSQNVRQLLTSMVTAGALGSLSAAFPELNLTANATNTFGQQLQAQLINGVVGAGISTAINSGDRNSYRDALRLSIVSAVINTAAAQGANAIGDAATGKLDPVTGQITEPAINRFAQQFAHAVLGCAVGAATGASQGQAGSGNASACGAGALGAVVGELSAGMYSNGSTSGTATNTSTTTGTNNNASTIAFARLMSGVAVALAGGTPQQINLGATTGGNAAENNFLRHVDAQNMAGELSACKAKPGGCNDDEVMSISRRYLAISSQNIANIDQCVLKGDVACVKTQMGQAATAAEVNVLPFGYAVDQNNFTQRQNNVLDYGSVRGQQSLFGTDLQQAQEVAQFRQSNCQGMSTSTCDGLTRQALDDRMTRAGILMVAGGAASVVGTGLRSLRLPTRTTGVAGAAVVVDEAAAQSATSGGTANAATGPKLAGQLASENLANIAAQDARLAAAVNGSGTSNPNFSMGTGTAADANRLGTIWVGEGYTVASDGMTLLSADGARAYRPPAIKPNTPAQFNPTGVQANFVTQTIDPITGARTIVSNGHLAVTP